MTSITPTSTPSDEQDFLKYLEQHDDPLLSGKTTVNLADAALSSSDAAQVELRQLLNSLRSVKTQDKSHTNIETDDQFETESTNRNLQESDDSHDFGRFIIRERIASGGHGIVFRAYDPKIQREVALKLPRLSSVSTPELRERLLNEARIEGALDHPNVVRILEASEISGVLYIVYPFFNGPNLSEWLKERYETGQIPDEQLVLDIFRQIVDGTAFAHEHGIIHRDIKPSNILLSSEPSSVVSDNIGEELCNSLVPCICDFGIAKDFHEDLKLTATGTMVGTPEYISPEQICGNKRDIGPASDVYSLGVVLYEMLTGTTPRHGETNAEIYRCIMEESPRLIGSLRPDVSAGLEAIYLKCLEKKVHHRYQSALDLAAELRRFVEGKRVQAYGARSLRKKCRDFFQRKASLATVMGVAVCGVVLSLVLFWISQSNEANSIGRVDTNHSAATVSSSKPTLSPSELRQRRSSYISDMKLGYSLWQEGAELAGSDVPHHAIPRLLKLHVSQGGESDFRRFEWHYLNRLVNPQRATAKLAALNALSGHERDVFSVTFSSDGQHIATAGYDRTARLWDARTSELIRVFRGHSNDVNVVRFSPDGKLLATGSDDETIRLWKVDDGKCIGELNGHDGWVYELGFSMSGKLIASGAHDGTVRIWDVDSRKNIATFENHNRRVLGLEWSQDGNRLASAGSEGTIIIRKLPSFEIEHEIDISQTYLLHRPSSLAFSPDFRLLAVGTHKDKWPHEDGPILIIETQSGQIVSTLRGHQRRVRAVAFVPGLSSDQYTLIATSDEGRTLMWDVATGSNWEPFPGFDVRCWELAVSADGQGIAAAGSDQQVYLWKTNDDLSIRSDQRWTLLPGGTSSNFAFSPNGHFIVDGYFTETTGGIRLWDLSYHPPRLVKEKSARRPVELNFSPNGRALAFGENLENGNESKVSFLNAQSLEEEYRNAPPRIEGKCHFLEYSSDGTKLVGIAELEDHTCEVRIWDASKGQLLKSIPCFPPTKAPIAISPNGETFAVARESGVEIYDLNSLKLISSIDDKSRAYGMSFAPDGQSLAIGRSNGSVFVHETGSVTNQSIFGLDHPHIEQIAYSPQGDRLVAVYRGQLTILSVPDHKILCSLPAPAETVYFRNVEFSPDGRILAAIRCDKGGNEQVILWDSRLPGI